MPRSFWRRPAASSVTRSRDGKKTVHSHFVHGALARVRSGDLIGFVAERGGPVLWKVAAALHYYDNHVEAVRSGHGDSLWPGASLLTDEELDLQFRESCRKDISDSREDYISTFSSSETNRVVCWVLEEPPRPLRVPGFERSREREHRLAFLEAAAARREGTADTGGSLLGKGAWALSGMVHAFIRRRRSAALSIQRCARRYSARLIARLLCTSIDEGPTSGSPTASPLPEVAREDPPTTACS